MSLALADERLLALLLLGQDLAHGAIGTDALNPERAPRAGLHGGNVAPLVREPAGTVRAEAAACWTVLGVSTDVSSPPRMSAVKGGLRRKCYYYETMRYHR